jgi:hypothetical protein
MSLFMTIDSKKYTLPKGSVKAVALDLSATGFQGKVNFIMSTEEKTSSFFLKFIQSDLIEIELLVAGVFNQPDPLPLPLKMKGLVTKKSVQEIPFEKVDTSPILYYDYEIEIMDSPQVLWKQHYPIKLYTEKKMSAVITDNSPEGGGPVMDWPELEKTHGHICLALGNDQTRASFYDFIMWYVQSRGGICYFDYLLQSLKISGKKQEDIPITTLDRDDIEDYRLVIPETLRNNIRIHNSSTENHSTVELKQEKAVLGISHDRITRTTLATDLETLKQFEKKNLDIPLSEVHIVFKQFPPKSFLPGSIVEFSPEKWFKRISFSSKLFRVRKLGFHATAVHTETENNINAEHAEFNVEMTAKMEEKDNPARIFPEFKTPQYPLMVEGKIISEIGEKTDKTFQIYTDDDTSLEYYHVKIPLWDLDVRTPFVTDIATGHYFFPAFKDTRIVVDLFLHHACINRFLDWGEGTRLPMDSQGNHILFGKNNLSETSLKYLYEENKPVFSIKRTSETDTELIKMSEESIIFQTKEE